MNQHYPVANSRTDTAMTLVEFVVVLIIIAVLLWVLLPPLAGKGTSIRVVDMANLRQIGAVMAAYAEDHDDWLPQHPRDAKQFLDDESYDSHDMWLNPYQSDDAQIDRGNFDGVAARFGGYVFVNLGDNIDDIEDPSITILAYTAKVSEKQTTRGVQFVDGHVESWEEKQLRAALPAGVDVDALDGP